MFPDPAPIQKDKRQAMPCQGGRAALQNYKMFSGSQPNSWGFWPVAASVLSCLQRFAPEGVIRCAARMHTRTHAHELYSCTFLHSTIILHSAHDHWAWFFKGNPWFPGQNGIRASNVSDHGAVALKASVLKALRFQSFGRQL